MMVVPQFHGWEVGGFCDTGVALESWFWVVAESSDLIEILRRYLLLSKPNFPVADRIHRRFFPDDLSE